MALAPCGHGQQDFSLTPQLPQGGTLLPLSPGGRVSLCWTISVWFWFYVEFIQCKCVFYCVLTVSSPDLVKGHQPRARFCWKIEILSVTSVNMSTLHNLAVFDPRGNPWRSNSSVPAKKTPKKPQSQSRQNTMVFCFVLFFATIWTEFTGRVNC